jgi:hypothetical protein
MDTRPPCCRPDEGPANWCARAFHDRTAYNLTPLHGPWAGWRMAGRVLVSPDGDRIAPERLRGLMFRETMEARRRKAGQQDGGCRVIALPARETFRGSA